jgi:hypothetical protein
MLIYLNWRLALATLVLFPLMALAVGAGLAVLHECMEDEVDHHWGRLFTAAAVAFTVSASGGATTSTVKLLTVEQADAALGLSVDYVPPGG